MKAIPIHQLPKRLNQEFEIRHFKTGDIPSEQEVTGAHRDDHYIFFLFEKGVASLMIDFQEFTFSGGSIYYILPGQVHHRVRNAKAEGWFLAVDTSMLQPELRYVFENNLLLQQPIVLSSALLAQCKSILTILEERSGKDHASAFQLNATQLLLQSFISITAGCYSLQDQPGTINSKPVQTAHRFKQLLTKYLHEFKSPSAYAAKLHVTENYLNEMVKKVTGFPVSYWIVKEVMLEAKRLLYYSMLDIKEVAHELGYTDPAYFSRLFKKSEGISPLNFRTRHLK